MKGWRKGGYSYTTPPYSYVNYTLNTLRRCRCTYFHHVLGQDNWSDSLPGRRVCSSMERQGYRARAPLSFSSSFFLSAFFFFFFFLRLPFVLAVTDPVVECWDSGGCELRRSEHWPACSWRAIPVKSQPGPVVRSSRALQDSLFWPSVSGHHWYTLVCPEGGRRPSDMG